MPTEGVMMNCVNDQDFRGIQTHSENNPLPQNGEFSGGEGEFCGGEQSVVNF